jgi:hypothetical protein
VDSLPSLPDISGIVSGLQSGASSLITAVIALATMLGVFFFIQSGLILFKGSQPHNHEGVDWTKLGGTLLVGTMLMQFVLSVNNTTTLVTGSQVSDYTQAMQYIPMAAQSSFWESVLEACLAWVVALGWVAVLRGLLLWKASANGKTSRGDEIWRGATHILGGAAAINIGVLLQGLASSGTGS